VLNFGPKCGGEGALLQQRNPRLGLAAGRTASVAEAGSVIIGPFAPGFGMAVVAPAPSPAGPAW
jgi:hypothetical protein